MARIIVLVAGIIMIAFIIWWFFGKHEIQQGTATTSKNEQRIDVEVKGGYSPETVVLKKGIPATINFTRRDPSSCLDRVVFPDFGINQELPKDEKKEVKIDTRQAGEFQWACGMDMFHGKLIIK